MDEYEWLHGSSPQAMLDCAQMDEARPRKLRHFAAACVRRIWRQLSDPCSRDAVELAERFADARALADELKTKSESSWEPTTRLEDAAYHGAMAAHFLLNDDAGFAAREAAESVTAATVCDPEDPELEDEAQATLLRDIFGNPFRPVRIDQSWLTWQNRTISALAQAAYDDRDLPAGHLKADKLAILADALEEAGCTSVDILSHLRGPGPHVRGCWVVDLLLGKE